MTAIYYSTHVLLILLSIPLLIPYMDRIHAMALFWLRPSRQIRPPLFNFKQKAQRRKIIIKYGLVSSILISEVTASQTNSNSRMLYSFIL